MVSMLTGRKMTISHGRQIVHFARLNEKNKMSSRKNSFGLYEISIASHNTNWILTVHILNSLYLNLCLTEINKVDTKLKYQIKAEKLPFNLVLNMQFNSFTYSWILIKTKFLAKNR